MSESGYTLINSPSGERKIEDPVMVKDKLAFLGIHSFSGSLIKILLLWVDDIHWGRCVHPSRPVILSLKSMVFHSNI